MIFPSALMPLGAGLLAGAALAGMAQAVELPSGLSPTLHEVLLDEVDGAPVVRFRFIAPQIDRAAPSAITYFEAEADFPVLCAEIALPYLAAHAIQAEKLVISMADRAVEFGTFDPDATQFFEGFIIENGACIWEGF